MSKPNYWLLPLGLIFFMTIASFGLSSCAVDSGPKVPPFSTPFNTKKIGEVYTFEVNVVEQLTYTLDVYFYITLPNKWLYLLDTESAEEERQLGKILGGPRKAESGKWMESGVPAKFQVQILESKNQEIILDKLIDHPKTGSAYMGRYTKLVTKNLPAGLYTIRINYLEGASELAPLHAKILFARAHHGK